MADEFKKNLKKGEVIFKTGDVADRIFFLQSGRIQYSIPRKNGQQVISQLAGPCMIGEHSLWGVNKHPFHIEALTPITLLEIPTAKLIGIIEGMGDFPKIFVKSMLETTKQLHAHVKTLQMQNDPSPCPNYLIPRMFYLIAVFAKVHGKEHAEKGTHLKWKFIRDFAFKVFQEPVERLESVLLILTKLKMGELIYKMEKENEDDEKEKPMEVLHDIYIRDPEFLINFADFYQLYFHKSQYAGILKVEEKTCALVDFLITATQTIEADRQGAVRTTLQELIQKATQSKILPPKNDHFVLLEQKGIFVNLKPQENGEVTVSFDRSELQKISCYWQIIREMDRWNERGKVLLVEPSDTLKSESSTCPDCEKSVPVQAKFCPECGAALREKVA